MRCRANPVLFCVAVWAILVLFTPASLAQICQKYAPKTSVTPYIAATKIIKTKSASDLTQWQSSHTAGNSKILGLGGGEIGAEVKTSFEMVPLANNRYCVNVKDIKVEFFARPAIHIASNFRQGSCEYSEVMAHEQKHVSEMRKFQREYTPKLRQEMQKIAVTLPQNGPVFKSDMEDRQIDLMHNITSRMNDYTQSVMKILTARQQAIDTLGEYERVAAKCSRWDEKLSQ